MNIIELAKEAGLTQTHSCCGVPDKFCTLDMWQGDLKAFAALVRAEALEEAAKVCESTYPTYESDQILCFDTPAECAAAIRGLK